MIACLCAASLLAACAAKTPESAGAGGLLLRGVSVIDGSGAPAVPHRDVLIRDGKIARIAETGTFGTPADARVVMLPGRTVIPGLIDMHAHLHVDERAEDGSFTGGHDPRASAHMLETLLRFGVTTVRDPGAPTEAAVAIRERVRKGELRGPRVFTAGRILIAAPFDPDSFVHVGDAAAVREEVAAQAAAGVDFIKVYGSMPPELVELAAREAHARGLRITGHLGRTTWREGAELGLDGIEHPASWSPRELAAEARDGMPGSLFGRVWWLRHFDPDGEIARATIRALVGRRVAVDPTLMAMHTKFWGDDERWTGDPDHRFAPPQVAETWARDSFTRAWSPEQHAEAKQQWPKLLAWIGRMHEGGVLLTVGTDSPTPWIVPGVAVHDEMELLAEADIPPLEILKMATWNGAVALGIEREIGLVREGYVADLVVLRSDPSTDIRHTREIEMVVQGGRVP